MTHEVTGGDNKYYDCRSLDVTIGLKEKAEKRENLSSEKLWLWSRVSRLCKSRFLLCEKIVNLLKMLLNYPSHCKEPGFFS